MKPHDHRLDRELDDLFASYREACPAPEPSADYMPKLWARIDAVRGVPISFLRFVRIFITASATACVVLAMLTLLPARQMPYPGGYVEMLSDEQSAEYQDVAQLELPARPYSR